MPSAPFTSPVEDSVPKVKGGAAVGEDLDFQRRWWRFERIIWTFFAIILLCDLLGVFGRGPLAKRKRTAADNTLTLEYERIERAQTPSMMTLHIQPSAIHDGKVELFVSDSVIKPLGAQRVAPQPSVSTVGNGGITYTFPASGTPADVRLQLMPTLPGLHHFTVQVKDASPVEASVFVFP